MLYVMVYRPNTFSHVTALPKTGENISQILQYRTKGFVLADFEYIGDHIERMQKRSNRKQIVERGRIQQEAKLGNGISFNRNKVAIIGQEIDEALKPILAKYGMESLQLGEYDSESFDIRIRLANEGAIRQRATGKLKRNKVNANIFGKPIFYRGHYYQIAGSVGLKGDEFYLRDPEGNIFRCGVRFLQRNVMEIPDIEEEEAPPPWKQ